MTGDIKSTLFRCHVARDQRNRDINVEKDSALQAVNVIVPLDAGVIAAGLISKRQLLNQAMLGQEMQCAIDRAIANAWILTAHALEDLTRGQMRLSVTNHIEDRCPL
jgi:hypothetical protein